MRGPSFFYMKKEILLYFSKFLISISKSYVISHFNVNSREGSLCSPPARLDRKYLVLRTAGVRLPLNYITYFNGPTVKTVVLRSLI